MKALCDLKELLMQEIEEIARKGELTAGSLETVHKLTDTVKNIDKICMLENGEKDYSSYGESMAGGSYRRGSYAGGGYSGNLMMSGGDSYRGGGYSGRRYSRAEGQDMVKERINEMMHNGDMSGEEMNTLHRAMQILDRR